MPNKLPNVLKGRIEDDSLSLAIDMGFDHFAVIEVTECVDEKTMKVEPAVQRMIERAGSYTEYVPRSNGIRIIGLSFGPPVELDCRGESDDSSHFLISIYRNCDRWVDISGRPIVDKPLRNIDKLIDELMADMRKYVCLR